MVQGRSSSKDSSFLTCTPAWEEEHHVRIVWNFFATSQGKRIVDGLGGTVKRAVWWHIQSGQADITSAKEYASVAKERNPSIHVHYIAKEDIAILKQRLDDHWEGVLPVPQTHKRHCFIPKGRDKVLVADTSDSMEFTMVSIRKSMNSSDLEDTEEEEDSAVEEEPITEEAIPLNLSTGQWVIVTYDGENFPGEILSYDVDIEVSVMHRSGKHWKWPNPVDKIFYRREDILQTITPPKVVGNRGQFTFDEVI